MGAVSSFIGARLEAAGRFPFVPDLDVPHMAGCIDLRHRRQFPARPRCGGDEDEREKEAEGFHGNYGLLVISNYRNRPGVTPSQA